MATCKCGRSITPNSNAASFCEEQYCSKYCRLFDERNMEMENRADKLKESGSKFHKNFSGFWDYPEIKDECLCCGGEVILRYNDCDCDRRYCSRECSRKILTSKKVRKSAKVFPMLYFLRHERLHGGNDGWVTNERIMEVMQRKNNQSGKSAVWPSILRLWISRGWVEKRQEYRGGRYISEYRMRKEIIESPTPLGQQYLMAAGDWD